MGRPIAAATAGGPPPPAVWPDWVLKPPVSSVEPRESTDPTAMARNRQRLADFDAWQAAKCEWLADVGMPRLPMAEHQAELRRRFPPVDQPRKGRP